MRVQSDRDSYDLSDSWKARLVADADVGIREVHDNTHEGLWPKLQVFLRSFRGVSKKDPYEYVAMFECGYAAKRATTELLRALLSVELATPCLTWDTIIS